MTAVDERGTAKCLDRFEPPEGVKAELFRGVIVEALGLERDTSEFGTFPDVRPHRCP
ncbi:hypothetical protein [Streptomyces sp. NPDC052727]|uniref:hypothetical protein n=1 Tax=unclassified Streptomyces TaxID=2593676 RepID=UPI00343368F2